MIKLVRCVICIVFVVCASTAQAQEYADFENLEEVTEKGFFKNYFLTKAKTEWEHIKSGDPLGISGGLNFNMRTYNAWGIENRQSPFYYTFNANASAKFFKIQIPFSIVFASQSTTTSTPSLETLYQPFLALVNQYLNKPSTTRESFARFGFSPTYKNFKLHLGHRVMNFSPLTMSNTNFFGIGTEFTIRGVRVAALRGRFADAVPRDLSLNSLNPVAYERIGRGLKVGIGDQSNFFDVIVFSASDDPASIGVTASDTLAQRVSPEDNLVLGINTQFNLELVKIKLEVASSAHSPNTFDPEGRRIEAVPGFLFTQRETSNYEYAIDASANLELGVVAPGFQYKRINPGYKSLGAFFFNDDIENINATIASGLFNNKLALQGALGIQNNNLDQENEATTTRTIGSFNANLGLNKFNLGLNYSNFTTDVEFVLNPTLDSLNAVVVTEDLGGNASYNLSFGPNDSTKYNLIFNYTVNRQSVTDEVENPAMSSGSELIVINANHSLVTPKKWRFTLRGNYNQNQLSGMTIQRFGFGAGIAKAFFEETMNLGLDANYLLDQSGNSNKGIFNGALKLGYQLKKVHQFSASLSLNDQRQRAEILGQASTPNFTELISTFNYSFNFSKQWKKKEKQAQKENETE